MVEITDNILKSKAYNRILKKADFEDLKLETIVRDIIKTVKKDGDKALFTYAKKFDGFVLNKKNISISIAERNKKAKLCSKELSLAIKESIENVRDYHKHQKIEEYSTKDKNGTVLSQRVSAIASVGLYIPAGKAPLFSTAIMTVIPAQLAGVKNIVAICPPVKGGIHPAIAKTLQLLGITKIFLSGGAQAIAALAYGTKSVPKVDKIAGPGNSFVATAKKMLYGVIDIDMIAGESDILIIADSNANPIYIAADMLSQAEHGEGSGAVLLTTSKTIAKQTKIELKKQLENSPRKEFAKKSLKQNGLIAILPSLSKCAEYSNLIAPEHLEVLTKNPDKLVDKLSNAGAIFIGSNSPEPVGDYFAGPNHVLPTEGTSRFYSPLGVYDFLKRTSIIKYSEKALKIHGEKIVKLADAEGLHHHAESVRKRLN